MLQGENREPARRPPKPSLGCFEIAQISMRFDKHALAGLLIRPNSPRPAGAATNSHYCQGPKAIHHLYFPVTFGAAVERTARSAFTIRFQRGLLPAYQRA